MKTSVASFDYDSFPAMTPYIKSTPTAKDKVKSKAKGKDKANHEPAYRPRTANQKAYVSHLVDPATPIVFGIGPAGCGKTLFACLTAINALKAGAIQKIVLTRPIVPVEEEELGFLPGTLVKKMDPWTRPLFDIFLEYYRQHELDFMISSGVIEISPLAYMRGRTFKRAFIIADEMQNSSPSQMLMLTTRIGEESKMVITGDLKQSDRCANNGLLDFMTKYNAYTGHTTTKVGIQMVHMDQVDIQRSAIVTKILDIYAAGEAGEPTVPPAPPSLLRDDLTDIPHDPAGEAGEPTVPPAPPSLFRDDLTDIPRDPAGGAGEPTVPLANPSLFRDDLTDITRDPSYTPPDLSKAPKHTVQPPVNITYDFFTPLSMTSMTNTNNSITPYVPPDLSKAPKKPLFTYLVDYNSLVNYTTFYLAGGEPTVFRPPSHLPLSGKSSSETSTPSSNNDAALFPLDKEPKHASNINPANYRRGW